MFQGNYVAILSTLPRQSGKAALISRELQSLRGVRKTERDSPLPPDAEPSVGTSVGHDWRSWLPPRRKPWFRIVLIGPPPTRMMKPRDSRDTVAIGVVTHLVIFWAVSLGMQDRQLAAAVTRTRVTIGRQARPADCNDFTSGMAGCGLAPHPRGGLASANWDSTVNRKLWRSLAGSPLATRSARSPEDSTELSRR